MISSESCFEYSALSPNYIRPGDECCTCCLAFKCPHLVEIRFHRCAATRQAYPVARLCFKSPVSKSCQFYLPHLEMDNMVFLSGGGTGCFFCSVVDFSGCQTNAEQDRTAPDRRFPARDRNSAGDKIADEFESDDGQQPETQYPGWNQNV